MVEQFRFRTEPYPCSYQPGQTASLDYRIIHRLGGREYEQMLRRGWRRFGDEFFRPACVACDRCRSLRIDVRVFQPARRHLRNLRRNAGVRVVIQRPTFSEQHLCLHNAYHQDMHERRGWSLRLVTEEDYVRTFLAGDWEFAREFLYYDQDRLIGVGLADVAGGALSSVYFFHDPEFRRSGLGVFSVLQQMRYAAERQLNHQYLGFWIAACPSMAYKSQYRPHEILLGAPEDGEEPLWRVVE